MPLTPEVKAGMDIDKIQEQRIKIEVEWSKKYPVSSDEADAEFWLKDLYKNYLSKTNKTQQQTEIILRLAQINVHDKYDFNELIKETYPKFTHLQKVWKRRELISTACETKAAPWRFYKSFGCAHGKSNATEKAFWAWHEQNSPIHDHANNSNQSVSLRMWFCSARGPFNETGLAVFIAQSKD